VGSGRTAGLAVLAIAQMGVHLVFFLHISTGPDNTNNVRARAVDRDARRALLMICANMMLGADAAVARS
jgi:hypothetical protein